MDNLRQLKADFYKYPEIYNSVTFINFVLFTIFCLSSTGTKSESVWWEEEWGLSYDTTVQKYHNYIMDTLKPWTWLCHSFMMNNFLSMSYAMILVHCLGHPIAATIGSKNLWQYVLLTSVFSGILMQAGQFGYYSLYHHNKISPTEKQFGPWDVCTALFLMNYYLYHVNPISFLLSFNGWLKYACLVGQLCICYFDWQPTVAGLGVGYLLCQFHPALRVKNFIK
ncbi:hypothetical protein AGDE_02971 [Angomonas deanei]|nr:hypothetical protein AGDE_02971 [Angomonas deanei]|eukprot:EPY40954.1 hypothetical protein AGDE_02971 [Angomonas deanei]